MSEFKEAWHQVDDVDKWEKGASYADRYENFEEFLEDMKRPVTQVDHWVLRMAGGNRSSGDMVTIDEMLRMTYKLDYAKRNLEYNKGEKEEKRQQLEEKAIGWADNARSFYNLDREAAELNVKMQAIPPELRGEMSREEFEDSMLKLWEQNQEDVKSQTQELNKEDARFLDSYLASITPGLT